MKTILLIGIICFLVGGGWMLANTYIRLRYMWPIFVSVAIFVIGVVLVFIAIFKYPF